MPQVSIDVYKRQTLLCACCFAAASHAQSAYVPTPDNLRAREAFRNDRFGIFLHWGDVYKRQV